MMMSDISAMCRFERGIEKLLEDACEKDGWIASVAISPDGIASLFLEKFGETPVVDGDCKCAVARCLAFVKNEFDVAPSPESGTLTRFAETIPNTRAPYHVTYRFNVDVTSRIAAFAA